MLGCSSCQRLSTDGRMPAAVEVFVAISSWPDSRPKAMRTDRRARFAWLIAARASGRKFCPAIVRRTPRGSRSSSDPPSSASKAPICCESDG
jgi:hypothetical protein